ncbi:MAG: hypothetical protein TRG1_1979 [Flavobacteriaceae bacterium FS1-H7996/R]|nr:MAG: hypothetical protein TRG1_1979 [Flavobacteriaceae bacterium FS1-H7996/R]
MLTNKIIEATNGHLLDRFTELHTKVKKTYLKTKFVCLLIT